MTRPVASRRARALALPVALAILVACSGTDRPTLSAWEPTWTAAEAATPEAGRTAADLTPDDCDRLLLGAREARPDLLPSPDEALDSPVTMWVDQAEEIGFDCSNHPDLDTGLEELRVLAAEINGGIAALESG